MNIAPNGKPSNLTPEQYKLVRTPAFKAWFGDWENSPETASKVVDSNGEPLVVYHGTDEEFTIFDVNAKSKWVNQKKIEASFFSETERGALSYLSDIRKYLNNKEGGKILKCFLKVINPIVADAKVLEPYEWYQADEKEGYVYSIQYKKEYVIEEAKRKGNDGVIFLNAWDNVPIGKIVTTFEPNQIKLADGTNTTFDSKNPDIRYSGGGSLDGIYYIPTDKSKEIIGSFTHYKSGENYYPKTIWANWFMSASRKHKERIAREISGNNEFKNALLSNWYDNYKKETNKNLTFEEFLNKDIEVYRGQTSRDLKYGEAFGFESYTIDESLAEHFAEDGNGLVITKIVKPKYTYGLIDSIGNEREIIIPTKYSKEFLEKEWYDFSNENMKIFDNLSDKDINEFDELLEKSKNYEGAIEKLKLLIANDIRYELGGKLKEPDKDLVVLHNINPYQIIEIDKLGGMVTPSVAILKAGESYTDFGEITLIGDKNLINPERESVRVFSGDVYSPSVPKKLYRISPELQKKGQELSRKAYASSKYRDFGGTISNLIEDYGSVYKDMRRLSKEELIYRYYEDLRLVYIIDKGIDFEIPYEYEKQYIWGNQSFTLTKKQKEIAKELLKDYKEETKGSSRDVSKKTTKGFYDLYWEIINDIKTKELEKYKGKADYEISKSLIADNYKSIFENKIGDENWIYAQYIDKISYLVNPKQIINKSLLPTYIKKEFTPEVEADYKKWLDTFIKKYQGDEYFEKGSKKIPYNLENLVEATSSSVRGQENLMTYSQNKAKSYSSKEFNSLDEIKKYKDRLVSKEKMNEIDEENKNDFSNLYEKLNYEYESTWNGLDSLAKSLADYYKGKSATQALQKNDFKKPSSYQIGLFEEYAKKLKNSPVDYFEAKIQRAVKLSEFKYAVVPLPNTLFKNIPEAVDILKKNGLDVKFYNPKNKDDRMNVVNKIIQNPDLRFDNGGKVTVDQYTWQGIKKAYVSIRIRYESGRAADDKFYNKYELTSFDEKPFEELKDHKLKGILGVSTSNYNLSEWLVHRECLVVMPFDKFKELNDTEQIQYYDADYLSKNGFDALHRLFNHKERTDNDYTAILQKIFREITQELHLEGMSMSQGSEYTNIYVIADWFNIYNSSKFTKYVANQKRINSPEELAQIVIDYANSEQSKIDYSYNRQTENLSIESIIQPIIRGIVQSGKIYVDESEWLIKNKELVIPENSQLFFVIKDYENMRDKYDEYISRYNLSSSYKIAFINQKNLNELQSKRFNLKRERSEQEFEKAKTFTQKRIVKAIQKIQNDVIEEWTNKLIEEFKESYSNEVFKDYDGNSYSDNILEVPSAIIYFDSLMLKFIDIYDSRVDYIAQSKSKYAFSDIFNDFSDYIDRLRSQEGEQELEVKTSYNRIYKYDILQKLYYYARHADYDKFGQQIKSEIVSDLYRYFSKGEVGFKNGGELKKTKMNKKILCPVGTEVQSLIFSKDDFSEKSAKDWAKKHDFNYGYVDKKENTFRIRQQEPSDFNNMRTIEMTKGVKAVIGCPKKKYVDGGDVYAEGGNVRSLLSRFDKEKPQISIYVIADMVAESILYDDVVKVKNINEKWATLTDEQKEKYNKDYMASKSELYKYIIYNFVRLYYSDEKIRERCKGQSRLTIERIKVYLYNIGQKFDKSKFPSIQEVKQDSKEEILNLIEVLQPLADEGNEEALNLIETLKDIVNN
jgi:hypothetical protein